MGRGERSDPDLQLPGRRVTHQMTYPQAMGKSYKAEFDTFTSGEPAIVYRDGHVEIATFVEVDDSGSSVVEIADGDEVTLKGLVGREMLAKRFASRNLPLPLDESERPTNPDTTFETFSAGDLVLIYQQVEQLTHGFIDIAVFVKVDDSGSAVVRAADGTEITLKGNDRIAPSFAMPEFPFPMPGDGHPWKHIVRVFGSA